MYANHKSLIGAHRGFKRTPQHIKRHFYWPSMNKELHEYFKICTKWQEAKSRSYKKLGKLRPFPPLPKKWEQISMDFIFDLPRTDTNETAMFVVVDELWKHTLHSN